MLATIVRIVIMAVVEAEIVVAEAVVVLDPDPGAVVGVVLQIVQGVVIVTGPEIVIVQDLLETSPAIALEIEKNPGLDLLTQIPVEGVILVDQISLTIKRTGASGCIQISHALS